MLQRIQGRLRGGESQFGALKAGQSEVKGCVMAMVVVVGEGLGGCTVVHDGSVGVARVPTRIQT